MFQYAQHSFISNSIIFKSLEDAKNSKTKRNINKNQHPKSYTQTKKLQTQNHFRTPASPNNNKKTSVRKKLMETCAPIEDDNIHDPFIVFRIAFASHKIDGASCPNPSILAGRIIQASPTTLTKAKAAIISTYACAECV